VRRVANLPFAIVYEWDSASRSLLYSKAMAKEKWRYNRATYKRYKSAQLHTKAKRRVPAVLWVLLFGLVATLVGGPQVYDRMATRFGWKKADPPALVAKEPAKGPETAQAALTAQAEAKLPASAASAPEPVPVLAGCIAVKDACTCLDTKGARMDQPVSACLQRTGAARPPPLDLKFLRVPAQELHERQLAQADDYDVLAYMSRRSERQAREAATPSPRSLTAKQ
jgi:zona occludens toxin